MGPGSTARNILIVDNDDEARRLFHARLANDQRTGLLWEATDPLTASALVEFLPIDVIVLDFLLAQGTAVDCLPALRQHRPQCRIVIYTVDVERAREAQVLGLGADDLVPRGTVDVDHDIADVVFGPTPPVAAA